MTLKTTMLSAASALLLSAGAAAAAPAVAESALNMRSGPGTQYEVVATIPGGAMVDVAGCTGSWCQVSFNGEPGFANRSYLAMGGEPSAAVVAPGYAYDDTPLYYDDGYAFGPGFGVVVGPRHRFHHHRGHWNGNWTGGRVGNWQGRPGWAGARTGTWQGGGGGGMIARPGSAPSAAIGARPSVSAPVGMPTGGGAGVFRGGASAGGGVSAGGAGVFHGGAGAIGRGQAR